MNSEQRHESFVPIKGSINLRDFGGYQTTDGQQVKKGLLFRCGTMSDIPDHAFDDFAALNIGVICDLRSEQEALGSPTPNAAPFHCRVHIPIWPGSSTQFQETAGQGAPSPEDFALFMTTVTREIARDHVASYAKLFAELIATDSGFLLHCSAGKDRTGFGAAIILSLLGVDRQTILADYLISNQAVELQERMRQKMSEELGREVNDGVLHILSGVREEYLLSAFNEVDNHFGGLKGYLEAAGITAVEEAHLKDRLLT